MESQYVIWSFEHNQWWAPNRQGYVSSLKNAGTYSREEAAMIVIDSVLLEEVAMLKQLASRHGHPRFHPYKGEM